MSLTKERLKPYLVKEYCKGCGRCISVCKRGCIVFSKEINHLTGIAPVDLDLEKCNSCGLCIDACPEPYGLLAMELDEKFELADPSKLFGKKKNDTIEPVTIADQKLPMPKTEPMVIKGNYAAAIGAMLAGCRHMYGYPITPSTEGAELMAKILPKMNGWYLQAVSEVATINHMYGTAGAGLPTMTFTSSPGFSLMVEGISYMVGAELPSVIVNVMRGGPGLGNIAPEQSDIKFACRGLGHGNTHAICLAPSTPQEVLDLSMEAFELAFKYRNPVIVLLDGYLGQMTGRVNLPAHLVKPGIPKWAVYGDKGHRGNLISSIDLAEPDLEKHNEVICAKYDSMKSEARSDNFMTDGAEILLVACNTPARISKGAVQDLRNAGIKAGLFRPITVWPFPAKQLLALMPQTKHIVVIEASAGQLEDELRLELNKAGLEKLPKMSHIRRMGGMLPQQADVVAHVKSIAK
ncbi:MAG: 3-methyl-2-oxobutanoate dehydrogenase subunit VorB [Holophagaceae bacterium]|nr:3-methyl-2-oxobutanoate dehydrogenase subunit VorB [Holophagaceae bacterium]